MQNKTEFKEAVETLNKKRSIFYHERQFGTDRYLVALTNLKEAERLVDNLKRGL